MDVYAKAMGNKRRVVNDVLGGIALPPKLTGKPTLRVIGNDDEDATEAKGPSI